MKDIFCIIILKTGEALIIFQDEKKALEDLISKAEEEAETLIFFRNEKMSFPSWCFYLPQEKEMVILHTKPNKLVEIKNQAQAVQIMGSVINLSNGIESIEYWPTDAGPKSRFERRVRRAEENGK